MTRFKRLAPLFVAIIFIQSCEISHRIYTVQEQDADFSQYRSFEFVESLGPSGQSYTSIHEKYLRIAIASELGKRGLELAEKPDLWVNFYVTEKDKYDTEYHSSLSLGYSGYVGSCAYFNSTAHNPDVCVSRYTESTLTIDVVDRARKQVVWQGVAVGRKKTKPPANWQDKVAELVSRIFTAYPTSADISSTKRQ